MHEKTHLIAEGVGKLLDAIDHVARLVAQDDAQACPLVLVAEPSLEESAKQQRGKDGDGEDREIFDEQRPAWSGECRFVDGRRP